MGLMAIWKFIMSPLGRGVLAFAAVGLFLAWFGDKRYDSGFAAAEEKHASEIRLIQIEVDQATAVTQRQAVELEGYREAAKMLAMETDNEILADGNACVPTADELQRARRRWSSSD
jgi:hypothetical protein